MPGSEITPLFGTCGSVSSSLAISLSVSKSIGGFGTIGVFGLGSSTIGGKGVFKTLVLGVTLQFHCPARYSVLVASVLQR